MMRPFAARFLAIAAVTAVTVFSTGCATVTTPSENDPFESLNRSIHGFNTTVDETLIKPVATGYKNVMPTPVNKGITNFFGNLNEVVVIANDLLQFKFGQAASDTGRLLVNSTVGVLGFIDVASSMGMNKHNEDFGQTLGYWGFGPGPYIVLPFLGPRTIRSTAGLLVDAQIDPLLNIHDIPARNSMLAVKLLDKRADLLSATNILEAAALDEYSFVRDAYLQRREYLVNDGNGVETEVTE